MLEALTGLPKGRVPKANSNRQHTDIDPWFGCHKMLGIWIRSCQEFR